MDRATHTLASRMRRALAGPIVTALVIAVSLTCSVSAAALTYDVAEAKAYPTAEKKIEAAISKGRTWVDLGSSRIPWPEAYKTFKRVTYKRASYIVKAKSAQVWSMPGSRYACKMKIKYRSGAQRKALNSKVTAVLKVASRARTQSEKIERIHDAINRRCRYDYSSYNSGRLRADSGNAYGSLVRGRSVCAGYAEAFQLAALKAGLQSRYVCNGAHAWNLVRVDGRWYHIDLCWDDTSGSSHRYYLKGSKAIAKVRDHKIEECYPGKVSICKSDYGGLSAPAGSAGEPNATASDAGLSAVKSPLERAMSNGNAAVGGGRQE